MKKIVYLCLVAAMFIAGCSGMSTQEEPVTTQILSKDGNFFVWQHLGRHYVLGSQVSMANLIDPLLAINFDPLAEKKLWLYSSAFCLNR